MVDWIVHGNGNLFIYRVYPCTIHGSLQFFFLIGRSWDRTSACKGAAGSHYQSIVDLTHPTHAYMKEEQKARPQHWELRALLFCE